MSFIGGRNYRKRRSQGSRGLGAMGGNINQWLKKKKKVKFEAPEVPHL